MTAVTVQPVRVTTAAPTDRVVRLAVLGALLGLMVLGSVLRFPHLGELTLQVDEGFQALAVEAILDHGYPRLESGYVYGRSPLFLYAQAASAAVWGLSEGSLRLPAALFGVLGIPIAYLLGRRLFAGILPRISGVDGAVILGVVLAAMVALSAWQIEYARYARFYTLFQCLYMLGLIAFHAGWVRDRRWGKAVFFPLFLLAVSVHDLGVMLGLCFWAILPLRGIPMKTKAIHFALSAVCGAAWVLYNKIWRGVQSTWATAWPDTVNDGTLDIAADPSNPVAWALAKFAGMFPGLNTPDLTIYLAVWDARPIAAVLLALPALAATLALVVRKLREKKMQPHRIPEPTGRLWLPLLLTAVWCAALHQFALVFVTLLIYAAVHVRSWRRWLRPAELVTLLACGVMFVTWVGFFWRADDIARSKWLPAISNVPAVYTYFLQWFVPGWTRMLVLLIPASLVAAHFATRALQGNDDRQPERLNGVWLLLVSIVAPILVTAELKWQFSESRYFLHLYPMMLGVLATGVVGVALLADRRMPHVRHAGLIAAALALGVTAGFTKDLNPAFAWSVTSRTHDSLKDPIRSTLNWSFYAHWSRDQASVSAAAADQITAADAVAVVGPAHVAANYAWYLPRIDAVIAPAAAYNTAKQNDQGVWIDLVTGGRVISEASELWDLARAVEARGGRLWLFSDTMMVEKFNWYLDNAGRDMKAAVRALSDEVQFTGRDGKTTVSVTDAPAHQLAAALPERFDPHFGQHGPLPETPNETSTATLPVDLEEPREATP